MDFLLAYNSRIDRISDHQIEQECDTIIFFLKALDVYISCTSTERFHLTEKISEKTRQHRNKCMEFERYLQVPKYQIVI